MSRHFRVSMLHTFLCPLRIHLCRPSKCVPMKQANHLWGWTFEQTWLSSPCADSQFLFSANQVDRSLAPHSVYNMDRTGQPFVSRLCRLWNDRVQLKPSSLPAQFQWGPMPCWSIIGGSDHAESYSHLPTSLPVWLKTYIGSLVPRLNNIRYCSWSPISTRSCPLNLSEMIYALCLSLSLQPLLALCILLTPWIFVSLRLDLLLIRVRHLLWQVPLLGMASHLWVKLMMGLSLVSSPFVKAFSFLP